MLTSSEDLKAMVRTGIIVSYSKHLKGHLKYPHPAAAMVQGTKQNAEIIKQPLPPL